MILDKIVEDKKKSLEEFKKNIDIHQLIEKAQKEKHRASFRDALRKEGLSIIGEIKKASPSKGIICENFSPLTIAKAYDTSVDAISVLTEEKYFQGAPEYLAEVSKVTNLPLLRKDFIIDPLQIYEAKTLNASAILLIVAILEDKELKEFIALAESLNMDTLVEIHDEEELKRALVAGAKIIGINNRNLKDFTVDINRSMELIPMIPKNILTVSESGINSVEDIKLLKKVNVSGILVGESFMKAENIQKLAKEFKEAYENGN